MFNKRSSGFHTNEVSKWKTGIFKCACHGVNLNSGRGKAVSSTTAPPAANTVPGERCSPGQRAGDDAARPPNELVQPRVPLIALGAEGHAKTCQWPSRRELSCEETRLEVSHLHHAARHGTVW